MRIMLLFCLCSLTGYAQNDPDTLYKVSLDPTMFPAEVRYASPFPLAGYMNKQGELIIPVGKYEACFSDEFTWFATVLTKGENACICAVDRNDNVLFEVFLFDNQPDEISDGMIRIVNAEGKIGYADHTGKIIVEPVYSWGTAFS